jgi:DNA topoisomerase-1
MPSAKQNPRRRAGASRPLAPPPTASARRAGLRYVTDESAGIRRVKAGNGFRYVRGRGASVRDKSTLGRIRSLVIPPAWTDVWICPNPHGHVQATGRDARGRKQYRYHPRWREVRDESKYDRLLAFARALPKIRRSVSRDLRRKKLERERVLATVIRLMDVAFIRVGNEEYARDNHSYGLTTMKDQHAEVSAGTIRLHFRGKSGKAHDIAISDPRLARTVRRCRDIPGQDLFQYYDDDGVRHPITSGDVNDYLREIAGDEFSSRDFRTWAGTVMAFELLRQCRAARSEREGRSIVAGVIEQVASKLGNTVAVCRKCYVHPAVFDSYREGALSGGNRKESPVVREVKRPRTGLAPIERETVRFLRKHR